MNFSFPLTTPFVDSFRFSRIDNPYIYTAAICPIIIVVYIVRSLLAVVCALHSFSLSSLISSLRTMVVVGFIALTAKMTATDERRKLFFFFVRRSVVVVRCCCDASKKCSFRSYIVVSVLFDVVSSTRVKFSFEGELLTPTRLRAPFSYVSRNCCWTLL